jgi:dCTP deaminase
MLMTDREIKKAIQSNLIRMDNYSPDCLQPTSYDMRVGDRAFLSGNDIEIDVKAEKGIKIKPGQFALITTFENIKMPDTIAGHIGVKSYFTRKGLILLAGLQIDPGFEGVLVLGVYNASPRTLVLDYLAPFCTIEFHQLSGPVEKAYISSSEQREGGMPRIDKDYLRTIETESLSDISKNLKSLTENVNRLTTLCYKFLLPLLIATFVAVISAVIRSIF